MAIQVRRSPIVLQTELADVQFGDLEVLRVWRVVPAVDFVASELDALYPLDLVVTSILRKYLCQVHLLLFQRRRVGCSLLQISTASKPYFIGICDIHIPQTLQTLLVEGGQARCGNPFLHSLVIFTSLNIA